MKKPTMKKRYTKPRAQEHKAVALVSGSGGGCNSYNSKSTGYVYYH